MVRIWKLTRRLEGCSTPLQLLLQQQQQQQLGPWLWSLRCYSSPVPPTPSVSSSSVPPPPPPRTSIHDEVLRRHRPILFEVHAVGCAKGLGLGPFCIHMYGSGLGPRAWGSSSCLNPWP